MAKCDNCYHYEACKSCHEEFNYMAGENLGVVNCPYADKALKLIGDDKND